MLLCTCCAAWYADAVYMDKERGRGMPDRKKREMNTDKKSGKPKTEKKQNKNGNDSKEHSKHREIIITVVVVAVMVILAAAGLWILSGEGNKPSDKLAFTVGEDRVYLDEVNFYILQNVVSQKITKDILDNTKAGDGTSAAEYYKQEILELIADNKIESRVAENRKLTITSEEESLIRSDAVEFMASINASVLNELGITQDMVLSVYRERYLAKKLENTVTDDIERESQKFCTIYLLLFPKLEMDEQGDYKKQEDGETPIMLSEDDIAKRKQDADSAYQDLKAGVPIEEIAEKYGVAAYSGEESNLTGSFGEPFSGYAESLKEGEYSPVLETESCYAILQVVKENNEQIAEQILSYYNQDVDKEAIKEEKKKWYEEIGVEKPVLNKSVWENVSLYDFMQYVED